MEEKYVEEEGELDEKFGVIFTMMIMMMMKTMSGQERRFCLFVCLVS